MTENHFKIELIEIHWLPDTEESIDLCAHGQVKVTIGNEVIVDRETDMHWSLRAMAMHLLRTLENNHTQDNLVGEHLIPCCGHHIDHRDDDPTVHLQGCFTGHNFWVTHDKENIYLETITGVKTRLSFENYTSEIIAFADKVSDFYAESLEKKLPENEYDRTGYIKFWDEWNTRRAKWE